MTQNARYDVERVKESLWVVVDKARQGTTVGRAADEICARMVASLMNDVLHLGKRIVGPTEPHRVQGAFQAPQAAD